VLMKVETQKCSAFALPFARLAAVQWTSSNCVISVNQLALFPL
jgi:hypothetical protein